MVKRCKAVAILHQSAPLCQAGPSGAPPAACSARMQHGSMASHDTACGGRESGLRRARRAVQVSCIAAVLLGHMLQIELMHQLMLPVRCSTMRWHVLR